MDTPTTKIEGKPKRKVSSKRPPEPEPTPVVEQSTVIPMKMSEFVNLFQGITGPFPINTPFNGANTILQSILNERYDQAMDLIKKIHPNSVQVVNKETIQRIKALFQGNKIELISILDRWTIFVKSPRNKWSRLTVGELFQAEPEEATFIHRGVLNKIGHISFLATAVILHGLEDMIDFFGEENVKIYTSEETAEWVPKLYELSDAAKKCIVSWNSIKGIEKRRLYSHVYSVNNDGAPDGQVRQGPTLGIDIYLPKVVLTNETKKFRRQLNGTHFVYLVSSNGYLETIMYNDINEVNMWAHNTIHPHARITTNWWLPTTICTGSSRLAELKGEMALEGDNLHFEDYGCILSNKDVTDIKKLPSSWKDMITHLIANTFGYVSSQSNNGVPYTYFEQVSNTPLFSPGREMSESLLPGIMNMRKLFSSVTQNISFQNIHEYIERNLSIIPGFNGTPTVVIHKETNELIEPGVPLSSKINITGIIARSPDTGIPAVLQRWMSNFNEINDVPKDVKLLLKLYALRALDPEWEHLNRRSSEVRYLNAVTGQNAIPSIQSHYTKLDYSSANELANFIRSNFGNTDSTSRYNSTYARLRANGESLGILEVDDTPLNWYHPSQLGLPVEILEVWKIKLVPVTAFRQFITNDDVNFNHGQGFSDASRSIIPELTPDLFTIALVVKPKSEETAKIIDISDYEQEFKEKSAESIFTKSLIRLWLSECLYDWATIYATVKFTSGRFRQEYRQVSNPFEGYGFDTFLVQGN